MIHFFWEWFIVVAHTVKINIKSEVDLKSLIHSSFLIPHSDIQVSKSSCRLHAVLGAADEVCQQTMVFPPSLHFTAMRTSDHRMMAITRKSRVLGAIIKEN